MRSIARLTASVAAALGVFFQNHAADAAACAGPRAIGLPLAPQSDGLVSVAATINGRAAKLIVDTGGSFGMIERGAAQRFGLIVETRSRRFGSVLGRIGIREVAHADALQVGRLAAAEQDFAIVPPGLIGDGVDGSLGADYLRAFDVDLDFAGGTLTLSPRTDCGARSARVEGRATDMLHDRGHHVSIPVVLGGARLVAVLDTGAAESAIDRQSAAALLGWDLSAECQRSEAYVSVNGGAARATMPHEFAFLDIGGWRIAHPRIQTICTQSDARKEPQLILGMDLLRRFHILISYRDERVYLSAAANSAPAGASSSAGRQ